MRPTDPGDGVRTTAMPVDLVPAFVARARAEPDRALFHLHGPDGIRRLTQGALLEGAWRYAALYRERGVRPGEVVFIALELSSDLLEAFLGAALAGCVPSFLPYPTAKQDPALFWSSHDALFRHVGAALVVTYPENGLAIGRHVAPGTIAVATPLDRPPSAAPGPEGWRAGPEALICLQHSSGTTGLKKGVPLTNRLLGHQIGAYRRAIGLSAEDRLVSWLPLYHDMGFVACFLLPLAVGCPVEMLDPFRWLADPLAVLEIAASTGARFAWMPNFAFQHLVNAARDDRRRVDLGGMRAFVDCSEPCRPETVDAFVARFAGWGIRREQVQVCYAMAEATFAVTQTRIGTAPRVLRLDRAALETRGRAEPASGAAAVASLSAGAPIHGMSVAILGPDLAPLPERRVGQVGVAGGSVFAGYHRAPDRTRAAFHEGLYLTGDLGFLSEGELHVLGRQDDVIIVLGRNVLAHEVEALVGSIPGIKPGRAVAFGLYNPHVGSEDLVVVAERDGAEADGTLLRRAVRARLESTIGVVPARTSLVDPGWLLKTTSGKISRGGSRDKYLSLPSHLAVVPEPA